MITVAEYISNFLSAEGVRQVFGYQGGAALKIIDAISKNPDLEYIQNFHEQGSAFCANATGQLSHIGVAVATSGPGATNLITGIANAYLDSIPVLFITGQDHLRNIKNNTGYRTNGFQDLDIISIVKPITKYAKLIENPEDIKYELQKACYFAKNGRKGAVLIDIPYDIQSEKIEEKILKSFIAPESESYTIADIKKFADIIKSAKKPLILAGGGIRSANAVEEFNEFATKTNIPVITTLNGKDCTDKAYGFSGFYGNSCANLALKNADLLIALGTRFGVQQTGSDIKAYTEANIIRVEIDNNEIGRTAIKEDLIIEADLKEFFSQINKIVFNSEYADWHTQLKNWDKKYRDNICIKSTGIDPIDFIRNLSAYYSANSVITTDVGVNQMWVAQAYKKQDNQRFLTSSALGSMGYSLPAAIGASYLTDDVVVAYMGDGGLQMNLQELNLLAIKRYNIKCVVFNNSTLGLIKQIQSYTTKNYIGTESDDFRCPDLEKLANCYNLKYVKIETVDDYLKIQKVFESKEPYIIDVSIDNNAKALNTYNDIALKEDE